MTRRWRILMHSDSTRRLFSYLRIKGKIVEYHRTYESDLRSLRIHDFVFGVDPQPCKFGQYIDHLKYVRIHNCNLFAYIHVWVRPPGANEMYEHQLLMSKSWTCTVLIKTRKKSWQNVSWKKEDSNDP